MRISAEKAGHRRMNQSVERTHRRKSKKSQKKKKERGKETEGK